MDSMTNISLQDLAIRVIRGEFGKGKERMEKLGYLYPVVNNLVNQKLSCKFQMEISDELITEIAKKALQGVFGPEEEREKNLDYIYPRVKEKIDELTKGQSQNKQNEQTNKNEESKPNSGEKNIEDLAYRVIRGEFGSGKERMEKLGDNYVKVQKKVNEILSKAMKK